MFIMLVVLCGWFNSTSTATLKETCYTADYKWPLSEEWWREIQVESDSYSLEEAINQATLKIHKWSDENHSEASTRNPTRLCED